MRQLLAPSWKNLFYPPERNEYEYFKGAQAFPYPLWSDRDRNSPWLRAAWAADAAMLAYGRWGPNRMSLSDFQSIVRDAGFAQHALVGDWSESGRGTQG